MSTAQTIIRDAQITLQDEQGVRWPAAELVRYLNRAQRDIQAARPDTTATVASVNLLPGVEQALPAEAVSLLDINANTSGERITKTDLLMLDAVEPGWRRKSPSRVIRHFMHDMRTPRVYRVYPPAAAGAAVQMEYSAHPVDLPEPTGPTSASVTGDVSIGAQHGTALLSMVLHYAYAKDAEYGGNAALSSSYLQRAQMILGAEIQSSATVAPKS